MIMVVAPHRNVGGSAPRGSRPSREDAGGEPETESAS
jgi:hypothetical protein